MSLKRIDSHHCRPESGDVSLEAFKEKIHTKEERQTQALGMPGWKDNFFKK